MVLLAAAVVDRVGMVEQLVGYIRAVAVMQGDCGGLQGLVVDETRCFLYFFLRIMNPILYVDFRVELS